MDIVNSTIYCYNQWFCAYLHAIWKPEFTGLRSFSMVPKIAKDDQTVLACPNRKHLSIAYRTKGKGQICIHVWTCRNDILMHLNKNQCVMSQAQQWYYNWQAHSIISDILKLSVHNITWLIITKKHLVCLLVFRVPPAVWPAQHYCVMGQTSDARTLNTATYEYHMYQWRKENVITNITCLLYTSPSPRD